MIEVEAKIKISDPAIFRKKISKIAKFSRKETKIDDYYTLENMKKYPEKSLRIRKKGGIYEINFKKKLSYMKGVHAKDEREFVLRGVDAFLELIKDFGFKRWLRKEKITELYTINKNFHIEINNLKNLGWFLEVEYLCDKKHVNMAREKVLEVIDKLDIRKNQVVESGYTKMLWSKKQLGV